MLKATPGVNLPGMAPAVPASVPAPTTGRGAGDPTRGPGWPTCARRARWATRRTPAFHALLFRAARFEVARRGRIAPHLRGGDLDDIANHAADGALVAVLALLDDFRGESRFTTWAYKFALLEAAVKVRRRAWQVREIPPARVDDLALLAGPAPSAHDRAELQELTGAIRDAIADALTPHQREVFTLLVLKGVPIDVLAERLGTTRSALYKTLYDARQKLRRDLAGRGFTIAARGERA